MKNFYVGAGFNAYGIAAGGGAGMALAEWVANGQPPYDLWPASTGSSWTNSKMTCFDMG